VKKMKKIILQASSTSLDVPLIPWTEYVGRVVDVTDNSITLETVYRVLVPISPDALSKWKRVIQKDNDEAVLALDDGSIRVREVPTC
jgi:hypothetical protein